VIGNRVAFHAWAIASERAGQAVENGTGTWQLELCGQAGAMIDEFLDQQAEEMHIA